MNNKEILLVVDAVSNEKGVSKEVIFGAIEAALAIATCKRYSMALDSQVVIDRQTGEYETFRQWLIVEDSEDEPLESTETQISLVDALKQQKDAEVGGYIREPMESVEFGRIAAQTANQVLTQKIRETERENVYEQFFLMKYHSNWTLFELYNLPVGLRKWFFRRLVKQKEEEVEAAKPRGHSK